MSLFSQSLSAASSLLYCTPEAKRHLQEFLMIGRKKAAVDPAPLVCGHTAKCPVAFGLGQGIKKTRAVTALQPLIKKLSSDWQNLHDVLW